MPLYEFRCRDCAWESEEYLPKWDSPNPMCPDCGGRQERLVSRFGTVFMGSMHKYLDKTREGGDRDGVWMYRKRTSLSGQPEPVYLKSMAELREFSKAEGLAAPGEVPTNATISADGKRILSDGLPGQWRGALPAVPGAVYRMDKSLTSLAGKAPAPVASGPPCTAGVADAKTMERFAAEGVV